MFIHRKDPIVRAVVTAAFPEYRGRTIQLNPLDDGLLVSNSRGGGSWSEFVAVRLEDLRVLQLTDFSTTRHQDQVLREADLPDGVVVVCHNRFCGQDLGIEIWVKPSNLAPAIDQAVELTDDELTVLGLHCRYTSAYRRECMQTTGITGQRAEMVYQALVGKGLLTRGRAINAAGRNAWQAQQGD